MPIFRGAGGAGDATNDATVTAVQAAATSAATSATNAANSATAAANSATGAATSATNASNSATTAAGQATTAAGHATNASTFATNSSLSADDAEDAATEAEGYASEAFDYKVAASSSASSASTSATNAAASAASITGSVAAAAASASAASTSATNASNSASTATTQAGIATTQATNASTSASTATTQATNASTSATAAAASAASAAASFDAFDDIYLGAKASNPTVDNDGNALTTGDQYFNTVSNELRVWNGSTWQAASVIGGTVNSLDVTGVATFSAGTVSAPAITTTGDTNTGIFFPAADTIAFTEGGVESMRIDSSGNLGIGTSSPNSKLEVVGNGDVLSIKSNNNAGSNIIAFKNTSGTTLWDTGIGNTIRQDEYVIRRAGTPVMYMDNAGNVGIGATSIIGKMQVNVGDITPTSTSANMNGFVLSNGTGGNGLSFGTADSGGYNWISSGYVNSASTGRPLAIFTAGTERMRIDSSGNVGIGTSSPTYKLDVNTTANSFFTGIQVRNFSNGSSAISSIAVGNDTNATAGAMFYNSSTNTGYGGANSFNLYQGNSAPLVMYTNATERMRIDSSGNVGIGVTPDSKLHVVSGSVASLRVGFNGTSVNYFDANTQTFRTSSGANTAQMNAFGIGLGSTQPSSGMGIAFPATQSASSDANTLDDYEEGTFTPTAIGASTAGTTTYTVQNGYYTKIGRQVNVTLLVAWSALTGTGTFTIQGLPFTIANLLQNYPIGAVSTDNLNWSGGTTIVVEGTLNSTNLILLGLADDAAVTIQQCVDESASVRVTLTYFTAT